MAEALPDAGEDPAAAMMPPRRGAKEMSEHRSCFGDAAVLLEVVAGLRATF